MTAPDDVRLTRLDEIRERLTTIRAAMRTRRPTTGDQHALMRAAADLLDTDPTTATRAATRLAHHLREAARNAEIREAASGMRHRQDGLTGIADAVLGDEASR